MCIPPGRPHAIVEPTMQRIDLKSFIFFYISREVSFEFFNWRSSSGGQYRLHLVYKRKCCWHKFSSEWRRHHKCWVIIAQSILKRLNRSILNSLDHFRKMTMENWLDSFMTVYHFTTLRTVTLSHLKVKFSHSFKPPMIAKIDFRKRILGGVKSKFWQVQVLSLVKVCIAERSFSASAFDTNFREKL